MMHFGNGDKPNALVDDLCTLPGSGLHNYLVNRD